MWHCGRKRHTGPFFCLDFILFINYGTWFRYDVIIIAKMKNFIMKEKLYNAIKAI